jgi:hypothetical protein
MSLVDRLRRRLPHAPAGLAWDDGDAGDLPVRMARMAEALDPDPGDPRLTASRAAVLGAFAATADRASARQGAPGRALPPAGPAPEIRRGGRRPALVLVAAGLLLAMSLGAVAASTPGGPLYGARVASEELFMPGSPNDRARAEVERLDARIAEASGASDRGDAGPTVAALRAYAAIAEQAADGGPVDSLTAAELAARVRGQLEVLARIGAGDPGLDRARNQAQAAARLLLGSLGEPGGDPAPGPGPSDTAEPMPSGAPSTPSQEPGTPGASGSPGTPGGTRPSSSGPVASAAPAGTAGPPPSAGPATSPGPTPRLSAQPTATPRVTPRTTAQPTATPGHGSGSGPPGGGDGATPRPSNGSQGGGGATSSASPPSRP